ncbi:hypothetical protein AB7M23_004092 [Pseudomonas sp. HLS-6 TE3448]
MLNNFRIACVTALLLLICGCQSYSTPPPRVVAVGCEKPPAPAAWFMEAREPNLTKRMLNELRTKHLDKNSGRLKVVELENDESPDGLPPVHTDRHIHTDKSAAEQAAKARLAAFNRSTAGVRLEMAGRTDLFAERTINALGFKPRLDGGPVQRRQEGQG